ncbi:MAG: hypothetical protein R2811_05645 [Flavobacteriales bacterium]
MGTRLKKVVSKLVGGSTIQEVTVVHRRVYEETYVRTVGGNMTWTGTTTRCM